MECFHIIDSNCKEVPKWKWEYQGDIFYYCDSCKENVYKTEPWKNINWMKINIIRKDDDTDSKQEKYYKELENSVKLQK